MRADGVTGPIARAVMAAITCEQCLATGNTAGRHWIVHQPPTGRCDVMIAKHMHAVERDEYVKPPQRHAEPEAP